MEEGAQSRHGSVYVRGAVACGNQESYLEALLAVVAAKNGHNAASTQTLIDSHHPSGWMKTHALCREQAPCRNNSEVCCTVLEAGDETCEPGPQCITVRGILCERMAGRFKIR